MQADEAPDAALGEAFSTTTFTMRPDAEGEVVATLIKRAPVDGAPRTAVLYVHGFADYFFQGHLADAWAEQGYAFYAIDLRKYGRSLLSHQTANYCADLTEYFEELDEAARIIRETHDTLIVLGHSTGGLITALWAHSRRDQGIVDGLALNSPWFDLNAPWLLRTAGSRVVEQLGRLRPQTVVNSLKPFYAKGLHRDYGGEWDFDVRWKPVASFPVLAGFVRAVRRGQAQLMRGLAIDCPVLVCTSDRSGPVGRLTPRLRDSDCVLNVAHMAERAPKLGADVSIVRIPGGVHDLALSPEPARSHYFDQTLRWAAASVR